MASQDRHYGLQMDPTRTLDQDQSALGRGHVPDHAQSHFQSRTLWIIEGPLQGPIGLTPTSLLWLFPSGSCRLLLCVVRLQQ